MYSKVLTTIQIVAALIASTFQSLTVPSVSTTWNCSTFGSGTTCDYTHSHHLGPMSTTTNDYPMANYFLPADYFTAGSPRYFVMTNSNSDYLSPMMKVFTDGSSPVLKASKNISTFTSSYTSYYRCVLAFFGQGKFFWGDPHYNSYFIYGYVTYSAGTLAITYSTTFALDSYTSLATNATLQGPSYLYCFSGQITSKKPYLTKVTRVNLAVPPVAITEYMLNMTFPVFDAIWMTDDFAVLSMGEGSLSILSMPNVALNKQMALTASTSANVFVLAMLYDGDSDRIFAALNNYNLVRIQASSNLGDIWPIENYVYDSTSNYDRLLNVDRYGLILGHMIYYRYRLRIMKKLDFSLVFDVYLDNNMKQSAVTIGQYSSVSTYRRTSIFFQTQTSPAYANMFYIQVDNCDSLISGNCTQCGTSLVQGFVTIKPADGILNPLCIQVQDLADGYGFAAYNLAAKPCSVANCQDCRLSYTTCFKCSTGYYLRNNTNCYSTAIMPAGFGVDGDYVVACKARYCTSCSSDAYTCTSCQIGFKLSGGLCVYESAHVLYGKDTGTGNLLPCNEPNCRDCTNNYMTCVACKNSTWPPFILAANGTCYPFYQAAQGYGLNSYNELSACSVTNCKNCTYNSSVCVECVSTPVQYYLVGASCVQSYALPSGFGANLSATSNYSLYFPCSDSFCGNCSLDFSKCTTCKTGTYLYNQLCYIPQDLPSGYGPSLTSSPPIATTCQDLNCDDCIGDYTVCRKCKSGLSPQLYASTTGICILATSISSYYGANTNNFSVQACQNSACQLCKDDYRVCTQCSILYSKYLYNGDCLTSLQLPNGYGPPLSGRTAVPCLDPNCLNCSTSYDYCSSCNPTLNPPRYKYNGECRLPSELPNKYGANFITRSAQSCYSTYCLKCQDNYKICTECDNTGYWINKYYLFENVCYSNSSLPAYYGANTATYVATPCSQSTCKFCKADYTKCTQCNRFTTPMTYLFASNNTCLLVSEIPDTYGAKIDSLGYGTAIACSKSNCQKCQSDYLTCTQCKTNTPPFYLYNNNCVDNSTFPDGIGVKAADMTGIPCASSRCQKCNQDYRNCSLCKTQVPKFYLYETTGDCYLPEELPISVGAHTTSGNATYSPRAVPCLKTGCQDCKNDYSICLGCSVTNGTATYLYNGNCVTADLLPPYFGADNTTYSAKACTNPRCKYCRFDYTSCTQCNIQSPELFLYQNATNVSCLTVLETPLGLGADTSSLILRPCAVPGCSSCFSNYLKCTACNSSLIPRVFFLNGSCLLPANLPDPYGADNVSGIATPCANPNCNSCKQNYGFCTDCKRINPETFLFAEFGTCVEKKNIPAGYGPDFSNYTLRRCADLNCKNCTSNFMRCSQCNSSPVQYYVNGSVCVTKDEVLPGFGIEDSAKAILPCKSIGCIDCKANYSECSKCQPPPAISTPQNPKYYLYEKRCDPCTTKPLKIVDHVCKSICDKSGCYVKLVGTKFSKAKKQVRAQFGENVERNVSVELFLTFDGTIGKRNLSSSEYEIQILNDVMLITLNLQDAIASGTLYLDRVSYEEIPIKASANKAPFFEYPLQFQNIYIETSSATKALDSASSTSAGSTASAKLVAQLVVITQNSNIAKIPDQMVSNMVFLRFLNGETYLYPAMVFDFFQGAQLPFLSLTNPWQDSAKQPNCMVAPKFFEGNLDCSILVNYGVDIVILYCTLAINILLSLAYYLAYGARLNIYKKHGEDEKVEAIEKSVCHKIFKFINDNYGLKMFFVKLDGTMVEVLFYASLTTTSQPIANSSYFYAYVVALGFYAYYAWSLAIYVRLIAFIKPRLDKIRELEIENKKKDPKYKVKDLNHYVDFSRVKHGIVGYQIEDYRADIEYIYMYAPLVWFLRCIWINIFLLGGTNMKSGQFYAYLLVEGAYLYYLVKSKVKASRFENWLSYFNEGSQIAYILAHIVGYFSQDRDFKQKTIGMTQAGIVVLMMLANIGYVFAIFFWDILIKPLVNICRKKPAFPPHERLGDDAPELRAQALGKVVTDKNRKKLVVSRAELDQFAASRQPAKQPQPNEAVHPEELKGLTQDQVPESPLQKDVSANKQSPSVVPGNVKLNK